MLQFVERAGQFEVFYSIALLILKTGPETSLKKKAKTGLADFLKTIFFRTNLNLFYFYLTLHKNSV